MVSCFSVDSTMSAAVSHVKDAMLEELAAGETSGCSESKTWVKFLLIW